MAYNKEVGTMKKHHWIMPSVILILLVAAMVFRWDYKAVQTKDFYVIKWKIDRWTGQQWTERFTPTGFKETPRSGNIESEEWDKRKLYDNVWRVVIGVVSIWLVISILKTRRTYEKSHSDNKGK